MRAVIDPRVLLLAGALLGAASPASAQISCSRDVFPIDGTQVAATLCATGQAKPAGDKVLVAATFSTKSTSFTKTIALDVIPGEDQSRAVAEVALAPLGLNRSLYITVAYKGGLASLAHAVLLPGALTLK